VGGGIGCEREFVVDCLVCFTQGVPSNIWPNRKQFLEVVEIYPERVVERQVNPWTARPTPINALVRSTCFNEGGACELLVKLDTIYVTGRINIGYRTYSEYSTDFLFIDESHNPTRGTEPVTRLGKSISLCEAAAPTWPPICFIVYTTTYKSSDPSNFRHHRHLNIDSRREFHYSERQTYRGSAV